MAAAMQWHCWDLVHCSAVSGGLPLEGMFAARAGKAYRLFSECTSLAAEHPLQSKLPSVPRRHRQSTARPASTTATAWAPATTTQGCACAQQVRL